MMILVGKCEQNHLTSEILAIGSVSENNRKVRKKMYAEIVEKHALGVTELKHHGKYNNIRSQKVFEWSGGF